MQKYITAISRLALCMFLAFLMSTPSFAFTDPIPFYPSEPYTTLSPVSVQLVYAKEYLTGHIGTTRSDYHGLYATYEECQKALSEMPIFFDMDSRLDELPTLREQFATYEEAFFEEYTLLHWMSEALFLAETYQPSPAPELKGLYLQNGTLFIDDYHHRVEGDRVEGEHMEYHIFITLKKEDLAQLDTNRPAYYRNVEFIDYSNRYHNPNTSDPTLPLLAAAIPAAAAPILLWKRKKARI